MTQDDVQAREGYLLLADISGYTAFLTGTELEHSHAIIRELTKLIRESLSPPMRFVKLEGDAVFCYAEAGTFEDGERFLELIEVCYFDFSNRLMDMTRETTCRCDACKAIPSLDLKFLTHFGAFMVERDGDREDLAGPDVILAHRLLKNTIGDGDGPQAYAFFSQPCMERMPPELKLPQHSEEYESFGVTTGGVHDLKPVLAQMRDAASEYLTSADADFEAFAEYPFPPSFIWQYFVDPDKRLRWQSPYQTDVEKHSNASGRTGLGSTSHCAHTDGTDITRQYIDWKPFRYFTTRFASPRHESGDVFHTETIEFRANDADGTVVTFRLRFDGPDKEILDAHRQLILQFQRASAPHALTELLKVMQEDAAALGLDESGDLQGEG